MTEEAEESGRLTGSQPFAEGDTAGTAVRPPGSSFSSSLGANASPPPEAGAASDLDSTPEGESSAGEEPETESVPLTEQLAQRVSDGRAQLTTLSAERPEVVVGAAFVGGLLLAMIIKRLAR